MRWMTGVMLGLVCGAVQASEPPTIAACDSEVDQTVLVPEAADVDAVAQKRARATLGRELDARYGAAVNVPDLGAHITPERVTFKVWAPTAERVSICRYDSGRSEARALHPMQRDEATGIWHFAEPVEGHASYYTYLVDVNVPGMGLVRNRVTDPYSLSLNTDSRRSFVVDLNAPELMPDGWLRKRPVQAGESATDRVLYELHLRDFSIGDASVTPANRGRYLAFTERESNGMRHLAALADAGVTDVHLLPVFDIASVPEEGCVTPEVSGAPDSEVQQAFISAVREKDCFNWGYDPYHFTAPEGSYASDPMDAAVRILEFRTMVKALQDIGLRVGMDVVYNHTAADGQNATSVLDRIVPGYYHRYSAEGELERSTCCANTATENLMMAKLMIDSAVVWARDYQIDSFRFDLMGHQPRAAMEQLQKAVNQASGQEVLLLGEGWNFGEVADGARFVQASQLSLNGSGIATFSDRARDAVRGGGCCDRGIAARDQGYINGLHYAPNDAADGRHDAEVLKRTADMVRVGLAGSLRGYSMQDFQGKQRRLEEIDYVGQPAGYVTTPGEVVNYVSNHDNPTLFDANVMKLPVTTSREDRARVQMLGAAIVAFSQGIAYYHAGMEVLRSKSLDRNSFNSGDAFNRLDWTLSNNNFGVGLPPGEDNAPEWPLMKPLLGNPDIAPRASDIRWMNAAFLDLLRIRASSGLFRLQTADEVKARLRFHNTGPDQLPTVLVGQLDGEGYEGAGFREVMYFINVDVTEKELNIPAAAGKPYVLHPIQASANAADARPRQQAAYDAKRNLFTLPPRSAVVFVLP